MPTLNSLLNFGLPVATSVVGGILGNNAVGNATGTLKQGGTQAINTISTGQKNAQDILNSTFQKQQDLLNPFVASGVDATKALQNPDLTAPFTGNPNFSFTPGDLANDPGYQFRLQNGLAAINAGAAASGNRFSGATLKALDQFAGGEASQEYQTAYQRAQQTFQQNYLNSENQFRQNEATKLAALQEQQRQGQAAAGTESAAAGQFGANTTNLQVGTSKAVADLQTQIANATAAGDIAKANQLQGVLNGITSGVSQAQTLNALNPANATAPYGSAANPNPASLPDAGNFAATNPALETNIAPTAGATGANLAITGAEVAGGAGAVAGGTAAATGAGAAAGAGTIAGGAAADTAAASSMAAEAAAAPFGEAGAAGAEATGSAGFFSGAASLLTNPITIGIGAAIAGAMIWKGTQTHPVADKFVQTYQNPFGQHLVAIVDQFDQALATGQLTKADAQKARDAAAQFISQFETDGENFAKGGDKEASVWNQAERTMAEDFGGTVDKTGHNNHPDWSRVLGKMDQEIAALPG